MAKSIQFKALSSGKTRAKISINGDSQTLLIEDGDTLTGDEDTGLFTLKAKAIQIGSVTQSVSFSASEIDKAGSDPALVETDFQDLYDEMADNFFPNAPGGGTPGGGNTSGSLTLPIEDAGTYPPGDTLTHATLSGKTVDFMSVDGIQKYIGVDFTKSGSTITYPAEFSDGSTVFILYHS